MSCDDLTLLCVTQFANYAQPSLAALAADAQTIGAEYHALAALDAGCVESVLDGAVALCETAYVLRVDDDETLSLPLLEWLRAGKYREADHWAFHRRNLWPDAQHYISNPPLWPDLQTRLSVKAKAGGRAGLHDGSPFGTGRIAPDNCAIDHHKFLIRSQQEREDLVRHYDEIRPGAGSEFLMFSVPERYEDELRMEPIG